MKTAKEPPGKQLLRTTIFTLAAFLLALTAVAPGVAQQTSVTPARPEIRGFVLEAGTTHPVADAEIVVYARESGPILINGGWKTTPAMKSTTDYDGSFRFLLDTPGPYRVEARKAGYSAPGTNTAANSVELTLTAEKPVAEARLYLDGPGRLTGRVVDEETGEPIPNLLLRAVRKSGLGYGFRPDGPSATTDSEGRFTATGLEPGEYAAEVRPQTTPEKRVLTRFTENDTKAAERDYEHTYWPGGHGVDTAFPVSVASGASMDVGVLRVRKVPYYRVHVRIPASSCEDGDTMYVTESVRTGQGRSVEGLASVPCGKELLVTGFAPGTYRLGFSIRSQMLETRSSPAVLFSIVNENIDVTATLTLGVAVDGVFLAAEGAKLPDLTKTAISLRGPIIGSRPVSPAPDGKFRIEGVELLDQTVLVSGLSQGNYIKEIRYNGAKVGADMVTLESGALAHVLTIVVDDKPGTIFGAVTSGDKPVGRPIVIAQKWPPPSGPIVSLWGVGTASGDDAGRFRIGGLAPGEYHVIAVRSVNPATSTAALERALSAAKKIEVGPSGLQNVTLEVTDLR